MSESVLEHVWIDVMHRKFRILADDGEHRDIVCDDGKVGIKQFLMILQEIRAQVPDEDVTYTNNGNEWTTA